MEKLVTKDSWKNSPIDQPKRIEMELPLTEGQFEKLKRGFVPKQMEDKWFVFYEKGWIYFHRSWTGYGIFRAEIKNVKGKFSITEFYAERNPAKYNNQEDREDIRMIKLLIEQDLMAEC
ncbi:hypothetical protein KI659_16040 [Litoribacter alkaliphilus]|uniref:Uncharacterized protein n=1 Tax=Litoribacter ruber TaxID=702568 RepID=A0AAP2CIT4_9BACT|nr:hypothetical protein [Litoribacter alkaliphilus]MBS9525528.1 hypothetical protein [Litoribacter alkaliphilus]